MRPQGTVRLARIKTLSGTGGIDNHPFAGPFPVQVDLIPVAAPLPDVAGHVVQPVAVGRESLDRRGAFVAVGSGVLVRKLALPEIGMNVGVGRLVIAPDVGFIVQSAARRELPLSLSRQALAGPRGIGDGVVPGDVNNGMIVLAVDTAVRPFGVPPVGAGRPLPPAGEIGQGNWPRSRREDE